MMDFLRGLAPRRDSDTSWAAPVLPSRFAGPRPLGLVTPPVEALVETEPGVGDSFQQPAARVQARSPEPHLARERVATPDSAPGHPAPHLSSTNPPHVVDAGPIAVERRVAPTAAEPLRHRHVSHPVTRVVAEPLVASKPPMSAVETRSAARPATPEPIVRRDAAGEVSRPLSAAVLAERPSRQTHTPPVIHVTIDRIEVRAPAPGRQTSSAPKRASEPTVSLTDYLRRPRTPGGAA